MDLTGQIAVVTGAASGIGLAIAKRLVLLGTKTVACVDIDEKVKDNANGVICVPFIGDTTDPAFRKRVFDEVIAHSGIPTICVPAAGIVRDGLAIKINKETKKAMIYSEDKFRNVLEVNLIAPTYWILEMVARIAESRGKWTPGDRLHGTGVFIGSIIAKGNKGQIAYSATKRALEAVAATLMQETMYYGVKVGVVHPGYTDTPMVRAIKDWENVVEKNVLPSTQLKRLVSSEEIASAVTFLIENSAVTQPRWVDAGWHPSA